jgi:hypothetical protein
LRQWICGVTVYCIEYARLQNERARVIRSISIPSRREDRTQCDTNRHVAVAPGVDRWRSMHVLVHIRP